MEKQASNQASLRSLKRAKKKKGTYKKKDVQLTLSIVNLGEYVKFRDKIINKMREVLFEEPKATSCSIAWNPPLDVYNRILSGYSEFDRKREIETIIHKHKKDIVRYYTKMAFVCYWKSSEHTEIFCISLRPIPTAKVIEEPKKVKHRFDCLIC